MKTLCRDCDYWYKDSSGKRIVPSENKTKQGFCRRFPPTVVLYTTSWISSWPATEENEFCGEGRKRV